MSCINSLTQADIGLSQKVMRNAKTFYHNSTIGSASGTCITFVKLSIGTPTRKSEISRFLSLFLNACSLTCCRHIFTEILNSKYGVQPPPIQPRCFAPPLSFQPLVQSATGGFSIHKLNFLRNGVGGGVCVSWVRSCEKLFKMSPPHAFINPIFHRYVNFWTKFQ